MDFAHIQVRTVSIFFFRVFARSRLQLLSIGEEHPAPIRRGKLELRVPRPLPARSPCHTFLFGSIDLNRLARQRVTHIQMVISTIGEEHVRAIAGDRTSLIGSDIRTEPRVSRRKFRFARFFGRQQTDELQLF